MGGHGNDSWFTTPGMLAVLFAIACEYLGALLPSLVTLVHLAETASSSPLFYGFAGRRCLQGMDLHFLMVRS